MLMVRLPNKSRYNTGGTRVAVHAYLVTHELEKTSTRGEASGHRFRTPLEACSTAH